MPSMGNGDSSPIYSKSQAAVDVVAATVMAYTSFVEPRNNWPTEAGWDTAGRGRLMSEDSWRDMSNMGVGMSLALPAGMILGRGGRGEGAEGIRWLETHLYTASLVTLLKLGIGRERPNHSEFVSFPSGHTAHAAASTIYATLLMAGNPGEVPPWAIWTGAGLSMASTLLTGWGRVGAGEHHWTDIFAGAAIGAGIAAAVYFAHDHIAPSDDPTGDTSMPLIATWQGTY